MTKWYLTFVLTLSFASPLCAEGQVTIMSKNWLNGVATVQGVVQSNSHECEVDGLCALTLGADKDGNKITIIYDTGLGPDGHESAHAPIFSDAVKGDIIQAKGKIDHSTVDGFVIYAQLNGSNILSHSKDGSKP